MLKGKHLKDFSDVQVQDEKLLQDINKRLELEAC